MIDAPGQPRPQAEIRYDTSIEERALSPSLRRDLADLADWLAHPGPDTSRSRIPEQALGEWLEKVQDAYGLTSDAPSVALYALECRLAQWTVERAAQSTSIPFSKLWDLASEFGLVALDRELPGPNIPPEALGRAATYLFSRALPSAHRKRIGAFHTPNWLAELVLDGVTAFASHLPLLDPACGFGVFLDIGTRRVGPDWPGSVYGFDVSPLAVAVARAILVARWAPELGAQRAMSAARHAVSLQDALRLPEEWRQSFPLLVGNPPWVVWDQVPPRYKKALVAVLSRWNRLVPARGFLAVLGESADDLSALFLAEVGYRLARKGSQMHFVFKRRALTNRAGRAFRALGCDGTFAFQSIEDLEGCGKLFGPGGGAAVVLRLERGGRTGPRLPIRSWKRRGRFVEPGPLALLSTDTQTPGGWSLPAQAALAGRIETPAAETAWPLAPRIRHGLKHDAEDVFVFLDLAPHGPGTVLARPKGGGEPVVLESERLFPYVKSRHLKRWRVAGWEYVLVLQNRAGQNVADFQETWPHAASYLEAHEARLRARRSRVFASGPFYGMFGLGPYSWAPYRLCWVGLGYRPDFAVVGLVDDPLLGRRPALLDGSSYQLPCETEEEVWFWAGVLNSRPLRSFLDQRRSGAKRGLGKAVFTNLPLGNFPEGTPLAHDIASLARKAAAGVQEAQETLDRLVETLLHGGPWSRRNDTWPGR